MAALLLAATGLLAAFGHLAWTVTWFGIFVALLLARPLASGHRIRSAIRRSGIAALIAIPTTIAVFAATLWAAAGAPDQSPHYSNGPNAVWSRHQWVGETHTSVEYDDLVAEFKTNRITDAFFHVGPLEGDGSILARRYPNAPELIANLKRRMPELRPQAWIGQVIPEGGGPLELANPEVRQRIVESSKIFVEMGFAGIHYNIEPVPSGDPSFIDLLRRSRAMTSRAGALLSIAAEEPDSSRVLGGVGRFLSSGYHAWEYSYYLEVIPLVDQIAVMAYDSGLPIDWVYTAIVRRYTARLITLVGGQVTLFVGVPTYEDETTVHTSKAENVTSALKGISQGVDGYTDAELKSFGVAIYAQWTTDETEWATYRRIWLGDE